MTPTPTIVSLLQSLVAAVEVLVLAGCTALVPALARAVWRRRRTAAPALGPPRLGAAPLASPPRQPRRPAAPGLAQAPLTSAPGRVEPRLPPPFPAHLLGADPSRRVAPFLPVAAPRPPASRPFANRPTEAVNPLDLLELLHGLDRPAAALPPSPRAPAPTLATRRRRQGPFFTDPTRVTPRPLVEELRKQSLPLEGAVTDQIEAPPARSRPLGAPTRAVSVPEVRRPRSTVSPVTSEKPAPRRPAVRVTPPRAPLRGVLEPKKA